MQAAIPSGFCQRRPGRLPPADRHRRFKGICDVKHVMAEGSLLLDELKVKVFVSLSDPSRGVSTTYKSYVGPFCKVGERFSDFLFSDDELLAQPPTILKVRMYIYQMLVRLGHCAQCEMDDPLPPSAYRPILALARVVSPLAGAMGQDVVLSVFQELRTVHTPRREWTLKRSRPYAPNRTITPHATEVNTPPVTAPIHMKDICEDRLAG
jgi:hypothetical protein